MPNKCFAKMRAVSPYGRETTPMAVAATMLPMSAAKRAAMMAAGRSPRVSSACVRPTGCGWGELVRARVVMAQAPLLFVKGIGVQLAGKRLDSQNEVVIQSVHVRNGVDPAFTYRRKLSKHGIALQPCGEIGVGIGDDDVGVNLEDEFGVNCLPIVDPRCGGNVFAPGVTDNTVHGGVRASCGAPIVPVKY